MLPNVRLNIIKVIKPHEIARPCFPSLFRKEDWLRTTIMRVQCLGFKVT